MPALVAVSPLVVVFLLLVFRRWPAKRTMPVAYVMMLVLALSYWKVPAVRIAAAEELLEELFGRAGGVR